MADHIPKLTAAESHNLKESLRVLGDTAKLVSDFDDLYALLSKAVRYPNTSPEDAQFAFVAILQMLAMCQRQLSIGSLALFRGYQGDAILHLRRAIDSCASACRIGNHYELAEVWLDAGGGRKDTRVTKGSSSLLFFSPQRTSQATIRCSGNYMIATISSRRSCM